ncbi:pentatricopeptide repeat-containing protein At4g38010 [Carica papaya]|uniref:pentatricopeptide repeat-containing protein At4g38010 n=1 Tax=Carica papaya TaxID=3649 RepID=UPI000B8D1598|nr:pentatricopeptide repeat-containing protein At4g38010 [Carica papaya]
MRSLKRILLDYLHKCQRLRPFKQIHAQLVTGGFLRDDSVVNKAVEFFGKSANLVNYACDFLKHADGPISSFPFNTLISIYASSGRPQVAIFFHRRILKDGFVPDMYTFPAVLKSCAKFSGMGERMQLHGMVIKMGFLRDIYIQNSLVHLYGVCGDFGGARKVFDDMSVRDVVSWTGIMSGFVRAGLFEDAVALFLRMDVEPNIATFLSVLGSCGRLSYLDMGKAIHGLVLKRVFGTGLEVSNALMDMYVKCQSLCEAKQIFDELQEKDIVSWTNMISGLVQCKRPKESLELFHDMQTSGVKPDEIVLTSVLSACASLGALDCGRWVHEYIDRMGIKRDMHIGTALIDMYAKCGCIEMALQIFSGMPSKNVFAWNSLLGGLALHGHGHEAVRYFKEMARIGMRPNEVTFLVILTACCHSGLVDEGRRYIYEMTSLYNLSPKLEHFGCMVDLLCKAGLLNEALQLIKIMPMLPDVRIWGAILSACKSHGNLELPQEILHDLRELESQDSGVYVLLSNIYASNNSWADVKRIRRSMREKGIIKEPGSSAIEVHGKAHEFIVGDSNHPQNTEIHELLKILTSQIYLEGHFTHSFLIR